ncbi:MAG: hypothetical protein QXY40_08820 [Candidatus Methanomethylicia archaeon]
MENVGDRIDNSKLKFVRKGLKEYVEEWRKMEEKASHSQKHEETISYRAKADYELTEREEAEEAIGIAEDISAKNKKYLG